MLKKYRQIALACSLSFIVTGAHAAWPADKPIEIIIPYAAGGETDVGIRQLAPYIAKHLNDATLVIMNKPGASGEIGTAHVERAKPDGYVFGVASIPPLIYIPMTKKSSYDFDKLELVSRVMLDPTVLVANPKTKYSDFDSIKKAVVDDKNELSVSNPGVGSHAHLATALLGRAWGGKFNPIAYNGTAPSRTAMMGGHVDSMMTSLSTTLSDTTGTLQPVMQFTEARTKNMPDVPTAKELGVDVIMDVDRGFIAPKGIDPAILEKFQAAVKKATEDPEFLKSAPVTALIIDYASGQEWAEVAKKRTPQLKMLSEMLAGDPK